MTPEQLEADTAYYQTLMSLLARVEEAHIVDAHWGVEGVCRCPRCSWCTMLMPADRVCLNCADTPDEVLGLDGSTPNPARAAALARRVVAAQFSELGPSGCSPEPSGRAERASTRKVLTEKDEEGLVPVKLTAKPGKRGYSATVVHLDAITDWRDVNTIDGDRGYRAFSRGRKTLLLVLGEPDRRRAFGVPISQEAAFSIVRYVATNDRHPSRVGHLGDGYAVLQLPY